MKIQTSRLTVLALTAAGLLFAPVSRAIDADTAVIGEGTCTGGHQTILRVEKGGKTVTYHLVENEISKGFHSSICAKSARVRAVGTIKEVNGRLELTASKLELVKQ